MARARLSRLASYLLGAFVCAELVYLPLANLIQLTPRQMPPLPDELLGRLQREGRSTNNEVGQAFLNTTGAACDRWGEATAQGQNWSLFAPRFGEAGTFLTIHAMTAYGPVELRSRFEPADPDHYVRFDVTHYRQFYREMSYALVYSMWTPDAFDQHGPEWGDAIGDYVRAFRHTLPTYVRWRLQQDLPDTDVSEVVVVVRVFLPPKPGEPRPVVYHVPLGRWTPDRPGDVMAYDPVAQLFGPGPPARE
jgi:hypothetical protein